MALTRKVQVGKMFVEKDCVFEHEGQTFEAGGAVVTLDYLIAYPADNGVLQDWHGRALGTWRVISSRPAVFFGRRSSTGDRWYHMQALVEGVEYAMRGFGKGMIARGRALKHK